MTISQWNECLDLIRSGQDYSNADDTVLFGCALPGFKAVTVTIRAAAKFIAWHCLQLNGEFDSNALNDLREISRKKWLIC